MEKSREAFRTISEVADLLDTPAHVLRFWESRFPQIRPVKRAGGRRYYRPTDVALLSGIKQLLHRDGLTIRGVQKILREHGIRHVMGLADGGFAADALASAAPSAEPQEAPVAEVLAFPDVSAAAPKPEDLPLWSSAAAPQPSGAAEAEPDAGPAELFGSETAGPQGGAPIEEPAVAQPEPVAAASASEAEPEAARHEGLPAEMAAEPGEEAATDWFPARLRALDARALRRNHAELVAISARLQDLRARMASAAGADRR